MLTDAVKLDDLISQEYQHGFFTTLETDTVPKGLSKAPGGEKKRDRFD